MMTKYSLTPGVIVERVGDDLMVIVPGNTDVVSLSGHPAEVVLDVQAGRKVNSLEPVLRNLADLGVITTPGVSRRGLIKAGAVGAGAGIAVLAMPSAAAASSHDREASSHDRGASPPVVLSGSYVYVLLGGGSLLFTVSKSENEDTYPFTTEIPQGNMPALSILDFEPPATVSGGPGGADSDSAEWQALGDLADDLNFFGEEDGFVGTFVFGGDTYTVEFNAVV
jgi:hypothetical protein